jgi:hypothetical protein
VPTGLAGDGRLETANSKRVPKAESGRLRVPKAESSKLKAQGSKFKAQSYDAGLRPSTLNFGLSDFELLL